MAASIEPCAVCTMIGGVPGLRREAPQHLHAVEAGHDEVEQDQGDGGAIGPLEDLQGLLAALGGPGLVAETLDGFFENAALGRIVVDDQDELGHVAGTRPTQQVTERRRGTDPTSDNRPRMTYSAERRVPHMGKRIVSLRPALMLFCGVSERRP